MTTLADFEATSIDGHRVDLADHLDSVVLVVNTASKCGFTPQYQGLQKLHAQVRDQGLVVLGFPCDQFMHQEPGGEAVIAEFCSVNFGVDFPMFSKIEVSGEGAHPLYRWLTGPHEGIPAEDFGWNFTNFLIGRDGTVRARYASDVEPAALIDPLAAALSDNA